MNDSGAGGNNDLLGGAVVWMLLASSLLELSGTETLACTQAEKEIADLRAVLDDLAAKVEDLEAAVKEKEATRKALRDAFSQVAGTPPGFATVV